MQQADVWDVSPGMEVATKQQASEKFGPGGRCGHQYGINIDHRFFIMIN